MFNSVGSGVLPAVADIYNELYYLPLSINCLEAGGGRSIVYNSVFSLVKYLVLESKQQLEKNFFWQACLPVCEITHAGGRDKNVNKNFT